MDKTRQGLFANPPARSRPSPTVHNWPEGAARAALMDAIRDFGYRGVVTNVPFRDGFVQNPRSLAEFPRILAELEERGLSHWLYDGNGYPSGYVGGAAIQALPDPFRARAAGFHHSAHYTAPDGGEIRMLANGTREPLEVEVSHRDCASTPLFDVDAGAVRPVPLPARIEIAPLRAVFLLPR